MWIFSCPVAEQFVVMYSECQVTLKLFWQNCRCRNKNFAFMQRKAQEKLKKGLSQAFSTSSLMSFHPTFIWKTKHKIMCTSHAWHFVAISEGKEIIIFLLISFFCTDSATNFSWPQLDADLSRHFSSAPCEILYLCMHGFSPTFSVSQPVFWSMICSRQTTAACPETTGSVSAEEQQTTHKRAGVFMKSGWSFSITLVSTGRWRLVLW